MRPAADIEYWPLGGVREESSANDREVHGLKRTEVARRSTRSPSLAPTVARQESTFTVAHWLHREGSVVTRPMTRC